MMPSRLTPETHDVIVATVGDGGYLTRAAALAGIAESTLTKWMSQGRRDIVDGADDTPHARLVREIGAAEGQAEKRALACIWRAINGGDVRAAQWWLTHRFPGQWADPSRVAVAVEPGVDSDEFGRVVTELAALADGHVSP